MRFLRTEPAGAGDQWIVGLAEAGYDRDESVDPAREHRANHPQGATVRVFLGCRDGTDKLVAYPAGGPAHPTGGIAPFEPYADELRALNAQHGYSADGASAISLGAQAALQWDEPGRTGDRDSSGGAAEPAGASDSSEGDG